MSEGVLRARLGRSAAALVVMTSCAEVLGLEDAAGELDGDGPASSPASTGATSGGAGGAPGSSTGTGGSADATTTGTSGGGGNDAELPLEVAFAATSTLRVMKLQATSTSRALVALDRAGAGPLEIGDCIVESSPRDAASELAVASLDPGGGCSVVDRATATSNAAGAALQVFAIAVDVRGDYAGWGGEVLGTTVVDARTFEADTLRPFARFVSGPFVTVAEPDADAAGRAFVAMRGATPIFLGHLRGVGEVLTAQSGGTEWECGFYGGARVGVRAAEIENPCMQLAAPIYGEVLHVTQTPTKIVALLTDDGSVAGARRDVLLGRYESRDEAPARIFDAPSDAPLELRSAIAGTDAFVGGSIVPDDEGELTFCDGSRRSVDAPTGFGLRVDVGSAVECAASWLDERFDRTIPLGRAGADVVYLLRGAAADDLAGWHLGITNDDGVQRSRRLCADCDIVDATMSKDVAWIAGRANSSDVGGRAPPTADVGFIAWIAAEDLVREVAAP